ncbi:MAG: Hemagglutinin-related protein [Rhodospirillales bacterium]|nr:Hemagglutinin-related protein [Rhodospirillales bacterium]
MTDTITGTVTTGVTLITGGDYSNPVTIDAGAIVSGTTAGISATDVWTIQNYGNVSGSTFDGIYLHNGGSVTNASSGTISGGVARGLVILNGAATVANFGTITGGPTNGGGAVINGGGYVTNGVSGQMTGYNAGLLVGGVAGVTTTIVNDGLLSSGRSAVLLEGYGSLTNGVSGTISGGFAGISVEGGIFAIDNKGLVSGGNYGMFLVYASGPVTNEASASIVGGSRGGILSIGDSTTVNNAGAITASGGDGVALYGYGMGNHGSVTNLATGTITGDHNGVFFTGLSGTVENAGTITGGAGYHAVYLNGTLDNRLIVDAGAVFNGDVLANATAANALEFTSGTISTISSQYVNFQTVVIDHNAQWDIAATAPVGTIEIAGTLNSAGGSVYLGDGAANRLIVDAGATFIGNVAANGAAANVLELSARYAGGAISGIGTSFTGFQTLTVDSGATWEVGRIAVDIAVQNAGTIGLNSNLGIELGAGGSVANAVGGVISGYSTGVIGDINGGPVSVDNAGLIEARPPLAYGSPHAWGVRLRDGGTVVNESTGTISAYSGIQIRGGAGTIVNSGSVYAYNTGVDLEAGGSVTNLAGASITADRNDGIYIGFSGAGTVDNAGTIRSGYYNGGGYLTGGDAGIYLGGGGSVTNEVSGKISAGLGFGIKGGSGYTVTVDNFGTIIGGSNNYYGGFGGTAIALFYGGAVTNEAGGTITGYYHAITMAGGNTDSVANFGTINGMVDSAVSMRYGGSLTNGSGGFITGAPDGVDLGDVGSVGNAGTITGLGGTGVNLGYGGSLTNAADGRIAGSRQGVSTGHNAATIDNAGTIVATDTTPAASGWPVSGVYVGAGGSVTNEASGSIAGYSAGISAKNAAVTIDNSGTIATTGSASGSSAPVAGVSLGQGGSVSNAAGGTIAGYDGGVYVGGAAGTVVNAGTIGDADTGTGVLLDAGGSVTNLAGGTITAVGDGVVLTHGGSITNAATGTIAGGYAAIDVAGSTATIDNHGLIAGDPSNGSSGIYLRSGGSVMNAVTGTITGYGYGVHAVDFAVTVENHGVISGTETGFSTGVFLGEGGALTNAIGATVTGGSAGVVADGDTAASFAIVNAGTIAGGDGTGNGVGLSISGGAGSVTNTADGTITGDVAGVSGLTADAVTIDNSGVISATATIGGSAPIIGMFLLGGGSIVNHAGGSITGTDEGIIADGAAASVDNAGIISGGTNGYGVVLGATASAITNTGTISGGLKGVLLSAGGSVSNAGTGEITGITAYGSDTATILNAGTITSGSIYSYDSGTSMGSVLPGHGVALYGGGTVTNLAGASITGDADGVVVGGTDATIENAGAITGGTHAAYLNASGTNRLIVDVGAAFTGDVVANASAANTIELTSGAAAGAISGVGTQFTGFQTLTIDSGAAWTIGGTEAGISAATIAGFDGDDHLDLTDLGFGTGNVADLNYVTDVLTIKNSLGAVLDTVTFAGDLTGKFFHMADDGSGGTMLTENEIACYCRGTRILTDRGYMTVEDLAIGDRLVTADGTAMSLKWIGRRSYAGWLAVGNPDVQPVRFKPGSLGDKVPSHDLLVSPEHAMFIDGVLIPARHLVNGVSILPADEMEAVEYFHLELDRHAVIFAEDAASESFVDDGSRGMFNNVYEFHALYPNTPRDAEPEYCAPRVEDGYILEAVRRRLMARTTRMLPNATAAIAPLLNGYLDSVTRTTIEGWAFEPEAPWRRVPLVILANGAVIGRVVADQPRAGLAEAGIGDGCHAYRFELPFGFSEDLRHEIEVQRESDWSHLTDSPMLLDPALGDLVPKPGAFMGMPSTPSRARSAS